MSWLLVALIPGLLMLAAFGLERVEAGLRPAAISAADIDEFLDQAEANDVDTRAAADTGRGPHSIRHRLDERVVPTGGFAEALSVPGLPTRDYIHHLANPEFRQTPHANRV